MAKIIIYGETGELKEIHGTFSKMCEITSSYSDEQKFVDAMLNSKNVKYRKVFFSDTNKSDRRPIYGSDIRKINQALKDQNFMRDNLLKCPRVLSDFVRRNVNANHTFYNNVIYKTIVEELRNLREKYIDNYYNFIIELMDKYNNYLKKKNGFQEENEYAENLKAAYDDIKKEIEEKNGKKEELQTQDVDNQEDTYDEELKYDENEERLSCLYSFFNSDYVDDNDSLSTIIISNDFETRKKLSNILNKCFIEWDTPLSNIYDVDFVILAGNDIRNDIKRFVNCGKPILAISLDKQLKINTDEVITIVDGFDEESIVKFLIKMHKECKKVRHYE